jgi:hypothetical protein
MAAVLAVGEGAVLSHRSAAALWRLLDEYGAVEVSSRRNARPRDGVRVRRVPSLIAGHCTVEDGIPCTTLARTLLDLAATASSVTVRKAVREAEFRRLFDLRSIEGVLADAPGHRGGRPLRAVLDDLSIGSVATSSELEDRFLELVIRADLPRPEVNAVVTAPSTTSIFSGAAGAWRSRRTGSTPTFGSRPSMPTAAATCDCVAPASRCCGSPGRT